MYRRPKLERKKSVFLNILDNIEDNEKINFNNDSEKKLYDIYEKTKEYYSCLSCYTTFESKTEVDDHTPFCFLEKIKKMQNEHALSIEILKYQYESEIILLKQKVEQYQTVITKIDQHLQELL